MLMEPSCDAGNAYGCMMSTTSIVSGGIHDMYLTVKSGQSHEQIAAHLRVKETHHIEREGRPPNSARASIPTAKTYLHDFDRLDGSSK
jgi:hypothetical protein